MIELTPEQWQAIAQEENPTVIEPASGTAYVVVPKDQYDSRQIVEADAARFLRITWMRRMGLDEEEITESLRIEPPASVETEMTELLALEKLKTSTPSREVLQKIAIKYY